MFANKFRSWMEFVRSKKKQRKEKQLKPISNPQNGVVVSSKSIESGCLSENGLLEDVQRKPIHMSRYSGANLSSPESAYSTGYSTDGTSPSAPFDCSIINRPETRYAVPSDQIHSYKTNHLNSCPSHTSPTSEVVSVQNHHLLLPAEQSASVSVYPTKAKPPLPPPKTNSDIRKGPTSCAAITHNNLYTASGVKGRHTEAVVNPLITSPRSRNRIRTNPWVPDSNASPELHLRSEFPKLHSISSPMPVRYFHPTMMPSPINWMRKHDSRSPSSSSCSSLSAANANWDRNLVRQSPQIHCASDEEEDCTLNEMMGKFDESYVYEKETDILSDSDPTDCDTDIDTGQDGGDEDDPLEYEFDFIDNGSHSEFQIDDQETQNTGHCTYHNLDSQRKSSRRKIIRKQQKQDGELQSTLNSPLHRKRSSSKRKIKATLVSKTKSSNRLIAHDGSQSADATPISNRRNKEYPFSIWAFEDRLRKRSNSVTFSPIATIIDQRDKEAVKQYKDLIVKAEHLIMAVKGSPSLRRLPNPANKRVELLRNAESTNSDAYLKNRLTEDTTHLQLPRIPSNNFSSPRFSPKKNHITNFIHNNSPVLMRREFENSASALLVKKECSLVKINTSSPLARNKLHFPKTDSMARRSPKHRRKLSKYNNRQGVYSSDSDSDDTLKNVPFKHKNYKQTCPQSEPVRRKTYDQQHFAFNCNSENISNPDPLYSNIRLDDTNIENTRQQVLLTTIANLKRSLEDQSASLRQTCWSYQNIRM